MNKSGMGVGSAMIVLIFAVLCLAIFTLITYSSAQNDMALVQAEKELVTGYYTADTQATLMIATLLESDNDPVAIDDITINREWDDSVGAEVASFSCPVSDSMELFVEIALYGGSDYHILSWRMRDTGAWSADESLSVWQGVETEESMDLLTDGGASLWGGK